MTARDGAPAVVAGARSREALTLASVITVVLGEMGIGPTDADNGPGWAGGW